MIFHHFDCSICSYVNTMCLLKFHSATQRQTVKVISGLHVQLPVTWANHIQVKAVIIISLLEAISAFSSFFCNNKILHPLIDYRQTAQKYF